MKLHKSLWPQKLEGLDQQNICDYDTLQVLYNPSKNCLFVFKLKLPIKFVKKSTRMLAQSSRKPLLYIKWVIRNPDIVDQLVSQLRGQIVIG